MQLHRASALRQPDAGHMLNQNGDPHSIRYRAANQAPSDQFLSAGSEARWSFVGASHLIASGTR